LIPETASPQKFKIALDAMGSDSAPAVEIEGAIQAVTAYPHLEVILVGPESLLKAELEKRGGASLSLSVVPASEVITMGDAPLQAIKQKKDASLLVTANLVKQGKAQAMVSAGNTGATMAAALMTLGRIEGVSRPAIATPMPSLDGGSVVLDAGANVDCKAQYLVEFAVMGNMYARHILHKSKPRVGLLNIGEEKGKGNTLVNEAYPLLEKAPLHFVGNVEGRDIINGRCDVVVCDGFTGNVILKFGEGLVKTFFDLIKKGIMKNVMTRIGGALVKPAFNDLRKMVDYSEYGGAPLLGVSGVCIICHGRSTAKAIKNALRVAGEFVDHRVNQEILEALKKIREQALE